MAQNYVISADPYSSYLCLMQHHRSRRLDGLRGIAIILVLIVHTFNYGYLQPWFYFGASGVELFFVLSGFLITGILLDTKNDRRYFRTFFARRALRILPLYYLVLALFFVLSFFSSTISWFREYQLYFWTYTHNFLFLKTGFLKPLGHFWSLAIEEQFYLFWPFIVFILSAKNLLRFSVILFIIGIVLRCIYNDPHFEYFFPLAHLDGLLAGSIIAILVRQNKEKLFYFIERIFIFSVLLLLAWLGLRLIFNPKALQPAWLSILSLVFGSLLIMVLKSERLGKIMSHPALILFGRYSYGLYVFNSLTIHATDWIFRAHLLPTHLRIAAYTGDLLITILLAVASFHLYERKFSKLKPAYANSDR
jgi:peptidoglycan/LPS O-acetylase OafA/YrhL